MNKIKSVLKSKGRTQAWLSNELGKSYNMVNGYVQNRRQPTLDVLYRIADLLQVDIKQLIVSNKRKF